MRQQEILATDIDRRSRPSEERLMLAVLKQALADLDDHCAAVRADAEAYFFSYGADSSAFSFDAVCAQFKLSASAVREALRKKLVHRGRSVSLDRAA